MDEISIGEEVLVGTFFLNEHPIIILFDSGFHKLHMCQEGKARQAPHVPPCCLSHQGILTSRGGVDA
jgi:hypothetical protein